MARKASTQTYVSRATRDWVAAGRPQCTHDETCTEHPVTQCPPKLTTAELLALAED